VDTTKSKKHFYQSWLEIIDGKTLVGLYLDDVGEESMQLLTHEEEVELGRRIRQGDVSAFHEMFVRNTRLVLSIAKEYIGRGQQVGLDYADLIQEGNIGLLTVIPKFDPELGLKFSTYATWWIHQRIARAIDEGGIIRIPVRLRISIRKVSRVMIELLEQNGKPPTNDEIASQSGLSLSEVEIALDAIRHKTAVLSLDATLPGKGSDDRTYLEVIADYYSAGDFELAETRIQNRKVWEMMAAILPPRWLLVITLRFGFRGRSYKLEEVGRELGITRERVRQIQYKALFRLWQHDYFRVLFREYAGKYPNGDFAPALGDLTERKRRGQKVRSDDGYDNQIEIEETLPLWDRYGKETERREILQSWELQLVPINEGDSLT